MDSETCGRELVAFRGDFAAFGFHALAALGDRCQILFNQRAGVAARGFRGFQRGPLGVDLLHHLQLAGFQFVDFLFVTHDLVADRLIFLVLAGFKLLDLEAQDGGAAGAGVEFETFQAQFTIDQRIVRAGDGGFIASQLGFGPGLVDRQFFEIFRERQQTAVTVLENQQRADFI